MNAAKPAVKKEVSQELLDSVESRLRSARAKILVSKKNWGAFGQLAMHLDLMPVQGLGTCATDGDHFLYDPEVLAPESVDDHAFNWAHEILHLFGMDLTRAPKNDVEVSLTPGGPPVKLWNLASDLVNNLILQNEGFAVPAFVPIDQKYKGWSKDQVYEDLLKRVKPGGGGAPKGRACGGLCGKPGKKGKGKDGKGPGQGAAKPEDIEAWTPTKEDEATWKSRAKDAFEAAKMKGNAPAFMQSAIKELLQSKVPWRDILWQFCTRATREWRYRPPSRTGAARGMVLPRLCQEDSIEHGVIVFDTSGSVSDEDLKEFCSEVEAIFQSIRMRATIMMVDAAVHKTYTFEAGEFDWRKLDFCGRGGTDFRPAFVAAEKLETPPTFLLYFTDTYGSFPAHAPEYPVLWAVTNPGGSVPWGQFLTMREKAV